jgi:hypothetical protein
MKCVIPELRWRLCLLLRNELVQSNDRHGEGFRTPAIADRAVGMGPAYENRSYTNPQGCGDGLWGFRVLLGCGDGGTGWGQEPARAW